MPQHYDSVTKRLIEMRPSDWVTFLGLPPGDVSLFDANLSTVNLYADRIIRVDTETGAYLVHNELESGKDTANLPLRLFHYNASAVYKTGLPVVSTVFLLHRESNSPKITGTFEVSDISGNAYFSFRYNVVRVWQLDADELLAGGLSVLPFAPIASVRPADVPRVIEVMQTRIDAEAESDQEAGELWTATNILLGLRYNKAFRKQIMGRVKRMRESPAYQEIVEEGRIEGRVEGERQTMQRVLLQQGTRRFGIAPAMVVARLESTDSLGVLEGLLDRVFAVETWDELLAPTPKRA